MIASSGHPTKVRLHAKDPPKGDIWADLPNTVVDERHPNWANGLTHPR